jgi:hypothetical protein
MNVLLGDDFLAHLVKTGAVPHNVRRVVIDAHFQEVVHVYYECFGDQTLLSVDTVESLQDCIAIHVEDLAGK